MEKIPPDFEILTPSCRMRIPSLGDAEAILDAASVPGFNDGMGWEAPSSREEVIRAIEGTRALWLEGGAYGLSIERRQDSVFIGQIGLGRLSDGSWEIGGWIHPRHQGGPAIVECSHCLIKFAFEMMQIDRLVTRYVTQNEKSARVVRTLGFRLIGISEKGIYKRANWIPAMVGEKLRTDWPNVVDRRRIRIYNAKTQGC